MICWRTVHSWEPGRRGQTGDLPTLPWLRRPGNLLRTGSCGDQGARTKNKSMQVPGRCPRAWSALHLRVIRHADRVAWSPGEWLCLAQQPTQKHRGSGKVDVTPQAESLARSACSRALEAAVRSEQRAEPGSLPYGIPRTTTRATSYGTSP